MIHNAWAILAILLMASLCVAPRLHEWRILSAMACKLMCIMFPCSPRSCHWLLDLIPRLVHIIYAAPPLCCLLRLILPPTTAYVTPCRQPPRVGAALFGRAPVDLCFVGGCCLPLLVATMAKDSWWPSAAGAIAFFVHGCCGRCCCCFCCVAVGVDVVSFRARAHPKLNHHAHAVAPPIGAATVSITRGSPEA